MPEINYNNPEFEWTLNDNYSWVYSILTSSYPSDMFIKSYTHSGSGSAFNYSGTCSLDVCLTTFAQQGFLILLSISGIYHGLTSYKGINGITINYNTVDIRDPETEEIITPAGTFSIPANVNALLQQTNFFLQGIKILSYRKRYLRFNTNDLEIIIHPSDWTSNFALLTELKMNVYNLSGSLLWAHNCFSINTDEWAFYTPQSGETYDMDEFPIWKDNNNNYWSRNITGSVKSYLKNRGSHFLFNQSNEFQKRDFSLIDNTDNPLKGNSNSQSYEQIGTKDGNNKIIQAYTITNDFNQIMHKKIQYNQTATALQKPNYKYFNNDVKVSGSYYTDLWDNNKGPTLSNPYVLYNNMTELTDSVSSTNLRENNWPSQLFWIDNYTLYCAKKTYYIPADWKVCMLKRTADNSALQFDSLTPSNYGWIDKSYDNLNYVSVTAWLYSYVSKWILNESFSNVVVNYFINQNNSREVTNLNSIWHSVTDEVSYSASVTPYDTEIHDYVNSANSEMRYNSTTSKITINYTIWMPTFLNFHLNSMSASYSPSDDTYAVINDSLVKMTSDIIKRMDSGGNISRIYESLEFKIANMNGFIIKSGRSIKDQKKVDLSTINLANGTYNYMLGDQKATGTQFWAGAYMYHGLNASDNNPNSYCIIAYNPNL